MKKVKLFTLTNHGPVAIIGLTKEPSRVGVSVACLHNSTQELGISRQYHDFVRRPTGLIERDFKHNAFRLDFSDAIDEGESWQLAAYAAHYLLEKNLLAGPGDEDATVICITGRLSTNKDILPVGFVEEKLTSLEDAMAGSYDLVVLPSGSAIHEEHAKLRYCRNWSEVLPLLTGGRAHVSRSRKSLFPTFIKTAAVGLVCLGFAFGYLRYLSPASTLWDAKLDGRVNDLLMQHAASADDCSTCRVSMFLWSIGSSELGHEALQENDVLAQFVACDGLISSGWMTLREIAQDFGDAASSQICKLDLKLSRGSESQRALAVVIGSNQMPVRLDVSNDVAVGLWRRSAWEKEPQGLKILVWSMPKDQQQDLRPEGQETLWNNPSLAEDIGKLQVLSRQELLFAAKKPRRFQ